jgi:hypothetical protein
VTIKINAGGWRPSNNRLSGWCEKQSGVKGVEQMIGEKTGVDFLRCRTPKPPALLRLELGIGKNSELRRSPVVSVAKRSQHRATGAWTWCRGMMRHGDGNLHFCNLFSVLGYLGDDVLLLGCCLTVSLRTQDFRG